MNNVWKKTLLSTSAALLVLFTGCGGGGGGSSSGDTSSDSSNSSSSSTSSETYKYDRITIAGSSITWGKGYMGENAYLGEVEKYFREEVADTVLLQGSNVLVDGMAYGGKLYKFGAGTEFSGSITGSNLSIAFAKERGSDGATVEVFIDGTSKGTFSTKGETVNTDTKNFNGNGTLKSFDLGTAHTFDHVVTVDGQVVAPIDIANKMENGMSIDDEMEYGFGANEWAIVRRDIGGEVRHFITFQEVPGAVTVSFKYAENIKPVKSSVDNVERTIGSTLESTYGDKYTSNYANTLVPNQGLDFRQNDPRAVQTFATGSDGSHSYRIVVKSGEFIGNFITNHMYYFQNAGIGGAKATDLLNDSSVLRKTGEIKDFDPDLFILESSTNDAGPFDADRKEDTDATSTNEWLVLKTPLAFTTVSSNSITLASAPNDTILPGDVVVMGSFAGNDIEAEIEVGIVESVSNGNKTITFTENVSSTVAKTCVIKRIDAWIDDVEAVVADVVTAAGKDIDVGIGTSGVPNLFTRRLDGYREKGKVLADTNGWMFYDFYQKTYEVESGIDSGHLWSVGDNTHPNVNGLPVFGEAVTDVLKVQ